MDMPLNESIQKLSKVFKVFISFHGRIRIRGLIRFVYWKTFESNQILWLMREAETVNEAGNSTDLETEL